VAELFIQRGITNMPLIIGVPDMWIEHGDQSIQQQWAGLAPEQIAARALERDQAAIARISGQAPLVGGSFEECQSVVAPLIPSTVPPLQAV
jgi:hypothetical protein